MNNNADYLLDYLLSGEDKNLDQARISELCEDLSVDELLALFREAAEIKRTTLSTPLGRLLF